MQKSVNGVLFKIMHKLNAITTAYLKDAKNTIKTYGLECVTHDKNQDIQIEYADATPKYSAEVEAEIAKIKARAIPINAGAKITKVVVKNYSKQEDSIAQDLYERALKRVIDTTSKSTANATSKLLDKAQ